MIQPSLFEDGKSKLLDGDNVAKRLQSAGHSIRRGALPEPRVVGLVDGADTKVRGGDFVKYIDLQGVTVIGVVFGDPDNHLEGVIRRGYNHGGYIRAVTAPLTMRALPGLPEFKASSDARRQLEVSMTGLALQHRDRDSAPVHETNRRGGELTAFRGLILGFGAEAMRFVTSSESGGAPINFEGVTRFAVFYVMAPDRQIAIPEQVYSELKRSGFEVVNEGPQATQVDHSNIQGVRIQRFIAYE